MTQERELCGVKDPDSDKVCNRPPNHDGDHDQARPSLNKLIHEARAIMVDPVDEEDSAYRFTDRLARLPLATQEQPDYAYLVIIPDAFGVMAMFLFEDEADALANAIALKATTCSRIAIAPRGTKLRQETSTLLDARGMPKLPVFVMEPRDE